MQIRLIAGLACACLLLAGGASATTTGKTMTPQQTRMAECSHQSKGMHGAAHKTFMSNCLKGHAAAPMAAATHEMAKPGMMGAHEMAKPGMMGKSEMAKPMMGSKAMQQEKMKTCSAEAKTKKLMGTARKTFMSECLKAH
jgi:hypothetical protein